MCSCVSKHEKNRMIFVIHDEYWQNGKESDRLKLIDQIVL